MNDMVKLVLEIGCNHGGNFDRAIQMIEEAHAAGADYAKFQKRCVKELLTPVEYDAPHPVPENSFGPSYGKHREALEFTLDQHKKLKSHCEAIGIGYACSVWDTISAREIASLVPDYIKIPSATNLDFRLYEELRESRVPLHISLGMTSKEEVHKIKNELLKNSLLSSTVFYHCIAAYPIPEEETCLGELTLIQNIFPGHVLGMSGHHLGKTADLLALALGARWIERHFTLDKKSKGTDHVLSLTPQEARELRKELTRAASMLATKKEELLEAEKPYREKLKKIYGT